MAYFAYFSSRSSEAGIVYENGKYDVKISRFLVSA